MDEKVRDYIVHVVFATRDPAKYKLDLAKLHPVRRQPARDHFTDPRRESVGALARPQLRHARGRESIGPDVLRHRIILTYEAEAQGMTTDMLVKSVFDQVPVP